MSDNLLKTNVQNIAKSETISTIVDKMLRNLTNSTGYNISANFYATGEAPYKDKMIYALVQCTRDLSSSFYHGCLKRAIEDVLHKYNYSIGARLLSRSCYLRYESYPFYENVSNPLPSPPNNDNEEGTN